MSKIRRVLPAGIVTLMGMIAAAGCDTDTYLVQEIASLRPEPTATVIEATDHQRWEYRAAAFVVLRDRTDDPEGMARAALARLDDPEGRVRAHAADIFQGLGRRVKLDSLEVEALPGETIPALTTACLDAEWYVRTSALSAVGEFGPGAAPAVPAVGANLDHPHPFVRSQAVWVLGQIGPAAQDFLPRLREMAIDTSPVVRNVVPAAVRSVAGSDSTGHRGDEEMG